MCVHKCDCVARVGFDDIVVKDHVQVVCCTMLVCMVEVVVQQCIEEHDLSINSSLLGAHTRKGDNMQVIDCVVQSAKCLDA
jgi:hypothetical protein